MRNALRLRTDVVAARKSLERSDYNVQYARNQLLPQMDLVANYGGSGAGGTQLIRDALGGPIVGTDPRRLRRRPQRGVRRDYPTWTVGVQRLLRDPQPQREGERRVRPASARTRRSPSFRRLELQVAAEVRTAARGRRVGLQARGLDAGRAAAGRRAARRRGEEVRRGHVHELPRDPGPARPRRRPRSTSCGRSPTTARASSTTSACRRPACPAAGAVAVLAAAAAGAGRPGAALGRRRVGAGIGRAAGHSRLVGRRGGPRAPSSLSPPFTRLFTASDAPGHLSPAASV